MGLPRPSWSPLAAQIFGVARPTGQIHWFLRRHWEKIRNIWGYFTTIPPPPPPALTAHVETRSGQHVSIAAVTHQVVSGLLPGAVEAVDGDAEDVWTQRPVGAAGQLLPVQGPVQRAGGEAELGAERARGCEAGADAQDGILGGHLCIIWMMDTHTHWSTIECFH